MVTELETASSFDTARAEPDVLDAPAESRRPVVVLGAIIVGTFLVYALLTTGIDGPRVHPDEELYTMGASSLAAGQGLTLRGQPFGFGPLFPAMLAVIIRLAGSVDAAYDWFKFANALCFALVAVPVYLLARRLVSAWWAVVAAGLSVAIPSAISVGTVMTESLSYLAAAWALYAIVLALERPSVVRQLAVLAAVAAAFFTRPQYGILYATWIGALVILWLIAPSTRPRTRADLIRFWPTALPLVLGMIAFGARLAVGRDRIGLVRRIRGALARLRPPRRREMVRLPPRGLRGLPRRGSCRGRADRALDAGTRRESRIPPRGRIRGAVRSGERLRAPRGRRVRE